MAPDSAVEPSPRSERVGEEFRASGFFALRVPLRPLESIDTLRDGLATPDRGDDDPALERAIAEDRSLVRARIERALAEPVIRAAVATASPHLAAASERRPEGDPGRATRVERALLGYLLRLGARPTPFGWFASCSFGRIAEHTCLEVDGPEGLRRASRLDMAHLETAIEALVQRSEVRERLRFHPNDTLFRGGGRLRYVQTRLAPEGRAHHLVAVDDDSPALPALLERAAGGATLDELRRTLAPLGADPDQARTFVDSVVEARILVPELAPLVTGGDPLGDVVDVLRARGAPSAVIDPLARLRRSLAELDGAPARDVPAAFQRVEDAFREHPRHPAVPTLVQTDLSRSAPRATLAGTIAAELARAADLLRRLAPPPARDPLEEFRRDFRARYESREVPLLEALDEECGIGFDPATTAAAEDAPLLEGLPLDAATEPRVPAREGALATALGVARGAERMEIELTERDLQSLAVSDPAPLPDAFSVMATLVARSARDADEGRYRLVIEHALGPSGARLLGRFCHGSPELEAGVREHLAGEESLRPDVAFAEVVHLPEGRLGNVICRPALREWEIPLLGKSGAPPERQLPLADLVVSVAGDRVVLRSRRLGREVAPRLTTAHHFDSRRSLGIYRFLGALQRQGVEWRLAWQWGRLESADFLPRVVHGRLVLSRARWRVRSSELGDVARLPDGPRMRALRAWRRARGVPRQVMIADLDHRLPLDLESPLEVDAFLHRAGHEGAFDLIESFPARDDAPVTGPEGRFAHELVVPFVRRGIAASSRSEPRRASGLASAEFASAGESRRFIPGSRWLYARIFCGAGTIDRVLLRVVPPLLGALRQSRRLERWHFVRYADPHWHLRLRLELRDASGPGEALERLHGLLEAPLREGWAWRVALETYEREIERYGGAEGIEAAETVFDADSDLVLALLPRWRGDAGRERRWLDAAASLLALVDASDLAPPERLALLRRSNASLARELRVDRRFERALDERFRDRRTALETLRTGGCPPDDWPPAALTPLARRAESLQAYARLAARERLSEEWPAILASLAHMSLNRVFRAGHRAQEMVLMDHVARVLESEAARARPRG